MTYLALNSAVRRRPTDWRVVPFARAVVRREARRGDSAIDLLALRSADGSVVARAEVGDRQQPSDEGLVRYLVVAPGQLVVNPMWLTGGAIGVSRRHGAVSPDYRVFATSRFLNPGYLHHLVRSQPYREQYQLLVRADTTFDRRIQQKDLDRMPVLVPPIDEQRRIADFLDDQVARIDSIIAARRAQVELLPELFTSRAGALLASVAGTETVALGVLARIIDTEHKTAPSVVGGGHWIAGTSSLRAGRLDHGSLRETDAAAFTAWTRRGVPRTGDVLLSREAPVGEVALLGDSDPSVAIGQRVVLIRLLDSRMPGGFIRLILMSPIMQRAIADTTQGSLHPHLNMSDISRLSIPVVSHEVQELAAAEHEAQLKARATAIARFRLGVALLQERKRSLITAAVTGEFDVSSASGRGIGVA